MLIRKSHPLLSLINNSLIDMPSPSNINYLWNMGSLLGMCLMIQILSGLFLAFHFSAHTSLSFPSVSNISRDMNNGWILRLIHANGASMFFILIYTHIGRGIYFSSFFFLSTWFSGTLIFLILMGTAFLGYVLPWGQMSFWGATVITNLLTAIPYWGSTITLWIWGGFSVDNATLVRFFSLHFILPFTLIIFVMMHIMFLHETGSNNPIGSPKNLDKIPFHPYFSWKDILGMFMTLYMFMMIILNYPYILNDPENFIPANPLVTPPHIQPEWYFLFAYAILRSIPNKLGGVMALLLSIVIILSLPFSMKNKFNSMNLYPNMKFLFWMFVNIFILLTFLGACPVEEPFITLSQFFTLIYFSYFILTPLFFFFFF